MGELIIIVCFWLFVKNITRFTGAARENGKEKKKPLFERVSEAIPKDFSFNKQCPSARPNQPRREQQIKLPWLKDKDAEISPTCHPTSSYDSSSAPRKKASVQKMQERGQDIMNKVNQHIYGTDASKADLMLYKNYLEVERRTDIKKMAREMECTMYQVISDIKDFQNMGYFSNVEIDDSNYVIRYKDRPEGTQTQKNSDRMRSTMYAKPGAQTAHQKNLDPIKVHEPHGSASVKLTDCDDCGTSEASKKKTNPYMTMPEHGLEIGYMTMTNDYTIGYMTMPQEGLEIHYNTMPDEAV